MGFGEFFRGLSKSPELFRFFERKGEGTSPTYYTCHGENASRVATRFYKTQSVVKQLGLMPKDKYTSVSLSPKMLVTALRGLLLVDGKNVEIWTGSKEKWHVERSASPGNLRQVEDLIATNGDADAANATVMAVHLAQGNIQRPVGVACINTTFCTIRFEFIHSKDGKCI